MKRVIYKYLILPDGRFEIQTGEAPLIRYVARIGSSWYVWIEHDEIITPPGRTDIAVVHVIHTGQSFSRVDPALRHVQTIDDGLEVKHVYQEIR